MKIIIDPYRGGQDVGVNLDCKYEKTILLELSKYMADRFKKNGFAERFNFFLLLLGPI